MSLPTAKSDAAPIEDKELSKDDVFNFLNEDGQPEEKPADKKAEKPGEESEGTGKKAEKPEDDDEEDEGDRNEEEGDEEENEEDELAELEAELEEEQEPTEEQLELVNPARRRDILKKYPNLFKEFPHLEKAYYREQQFTKYFPDPKAAKEAIDKATTLDNFEHDIVVEGNAGNILKLIKDNNPAKFLEVCDNYMTMLGEVDNNAYLHVLSNITKQTIAAMWKEGKDSDQDELMQAAVILNKYAFGTSKYKPPTKLAREAPPEDKQKEAVNAREQALIKTAYENAAGDVNTRVNQYYKINIENNIDPRKTMPEYVRKNAIRDAVDKVNLLISKDTRFKTLIDKLWVEASKSNFSKDSTDKIRKAFQFKGKSLLTPVIKSVRNEALRGIGRRVKDTDEETDTGNVPDTTGSKKPVSERRLSSGKPKATDIPKGKSTLDALNAMMGD